MGPYCKFCGQRCFTPLPMNTPPEALNAYRGNGGLDGRNRSIDIIATCPAGQAFEKERIGWCYDDIQAALSVAGTNGEPDHGQPSDPETTSAALAGSVI